MLFYLPSHPPTLTHGFVPYNAPATEQAERGFPVSLSVPRPLSFTQTHSLIHLCVLRRWTDGEKETAAPFVLPLFRPFGKIRATDRITPFPPPLSKLRGGRGATKAQTHVAGTSESVSRSRFSPLTPLASGGLQTTYNPCDI